MVVKTKLALYACLLVSLPIPVAAQEAGNATEVLGNLVSARGIADDFISRSALLELDAQPKRWKWTFVPNITFGSVSPGIAVEAGYGRLKLSGVYMNLDLEEAGRIDLLQASAKYAFTSGSWDIAPFVALSTVEATKDTLAAGIAVERRYRLAGNRPLSIVANGGWTRTNLKGADDFETDLEGGLGFKLGVFPATFIGADLKFIGDFDAPTYSSSVIIAIRAAQPEITLIAKAQEGGTYTFLLAVGL